MEFI
jgi:hypothetical protein